jgi:hypothetical protein
MIMLDTKKLRASCMYGYSVKEFSSSRAIFDNYKKNGYGIIKYKEAVAMYLYNTRV